MLTSEHSVLYKILISLIRLYFSSVVTVDLWIVVYAFHSIVAVHAVAPVVMVGEFKMKPSGFVNF